MEPVELQGKRKKTASYDEEVIGLRRDEKHPGMWKIYVQEQVNGQRIGVVRKIAYSFYKQMAPEKIIDFFEKHIAFIPLVKEKCHPDFKGDDEDSDKENRKVA